MANQKVVTLIAQAHVPVSMIAAAGGQMPDFFLERKGGVRVERGDRILVTADVASRLKEIKVLSHEFGLHKTYIPAFTLSL